jgi:hypothetical protein
VEPNHGFNPNIVKVEEDTMDYLHPVYSPMSMGSLASPGSPSSSGGGKMKRKKSEASTDEEDDLSNVPSLQMRIHLIQQRVSKLK